MFTQPHNHTYVCTSLLILMKSFRLFRFLDFVPAWSFDRVPVSELRVVEALAWPLAALLSRDVVSRDVLLCSVVTQYIVLLHVHYEGSLLPGGVTGRISLMTSDRKIPRLRVAPNTNRLR